MTRQESFKRRIRGRMERTGERYLVARQVDADSLRAMLLDAAYRAELFPGLDTTLRSRSKSQTIRVSIGPGVAQIA